MSFRQAQCRLDITRPVEPGKIPAVVVAEAVNEGGCAHHQETIFKVAVVPVQDAFVLVATGVVVTVQSGRSSWSNSLTVMVVVRPLLARLWELIRP